MSTPNFHRSFEGVPSRVPLPIPATFRLIATPDKQLRVASRVSRGTGNVMRVREAQFGHYIETEGVLKLEANNSYKIDYTTTFGV
jgi:hypothetical protein